MVGSGLQIFRAFPSFGAKIPQKDLVHWPQGMALGGWLGGGLQWHLSFHVDVHRRPAPFIWDTRFSAGTISQVLFRAERHPRGLADGAALFLLRTETSPRRNLQPAAEAWPTPWRLASGCSPC